MRGRQEEHKIDSKYRSKEAAHKVDVHLTEKYLVVYEDWLACGNT